MKRAALLMALLSLGPSSIAAPAEPPVRRLLLISIDTLRADGLGCYGAPGDPSPHLDSLAATGLRFTQATTPAPWTKPAHASLLTGLDPSGHGADRMAAKLRPGVPTLAERLSAAGYRTEAVVNTTQLAVDGLERGFDRMEVVPIEQGTRRSAPVTDRVLAGLPDTVDPDSRHFLFVHYMDVHSDYLSLPEVESRFVETGPFVADGSTQQLYRHALGLVRFAPRDVDHLRRLYAAGIRQLDGEVGRLLEGLRRRGWLEDAVVAVVSDHGEEFHEHGGVLHGHSQFEELLRVPLLLSGPGIPAGGTEGAPVSLVDVAPTLARLAGVAWTGATDGLDLRGDLPPDRALRHEADLVFPPPGPGAAPLGSVRAVRRGRFKLIFDRERGTAALFDLEADPGETRNVIAEHPEVAQNLFRVFQAGETHPGPGTHPSPGTQSSSPNSR